MFTRSALRRPTQRTLAALLAAILCPMLLAGMLLVPGTASAASGLSTVRLAAGHRVVDSTRHVWHADTPYARGGKVSRAAHHITGTATQSLYRSERVGTLNYRIPVTPGYYTVTLGMAEQVFRKANQRIYALTAEGTTKLGRVTANHKGRWHVYSVTVRVRVSDGVLDLGLSPRRHAAAVSAIMVNGYRHLPTPAKTPNTHPNTAAPSPSPLKTPSTPAPSTSAPSSANSTAPISSVPISAAPTTPAPSNPPPSTSAAPSGLSTPAVITPQQFGAVGNGINDDTAALQRTFDQAAGRQVVLPAGSLYAHSAVLHLRTTGLHVSGPGELLATNEQKSSVWIESDNVLLDGGAVVKTATTTQRWSAWEQMGLRLDGHAGIVVRNVSVVGSAAAGIYVGGAAHGFVLNHVTVQDTRADGIHMTGGAYSGSVISPTVIDSGDDGVAVVSYSQDGMPCHDITVTSPRVLGTAWGRGLSVVGGTNITEANIDVERTSAAAVYVGSEGSPWHTAAATNVTIAGGTIVGANTDTTVDHGAVLVLSGESNVTPTKVVVRSLTITGTRASASRDLGVITHGATPSSILFSDIVITGGPTSAYQGNTAQSAFTLRTIVQNGVRLPDAG